MANDNGLANGLGQIALENQQEDMEIIRDLENFSDISDDDGDNPVDQPIPLQIEQIDDDQETDQDFIPQFDLNDIEGQISFKNNRRQKQRREAKTFLVDRYASLSDFREHLMVIL